MCKGLVKSLLGVSSDPAPRPAQAVGNVAESASDASVKNTDVVAAASSTAGRESSGRVKLGGGTKRTAAVPGLSL